MITNFNEFKQKMNESVNPSEQELATKITECCQTALKCGLDRNYTLHIVEKVFTDPAKAPEEINVKFVKEHLDKIKNELLVYKDTDFGFDYIFDQKLLESKSPFELFVMVEAKHSTILKKLFESLKNNIKKEEFSTAYSTYVEGRSTLYISNLNELNEHNRNVVLNTLTKVNAINISTQLKWARTIA